MNTKASYRSIPLILILALLLTSCTNGLQGTPSVVATYSLPLLPIQIAYDFLSKKLSVSISGSIQTPLGTFGLSTGIGYMEKRYNGVRMLIIETGSRKSVYSLEQSRPYSITIPSDENGQTKVIYSGTSENITIVIPNPTNETISGLKEQLRQEQEAREQERLAAAAREADETARSGEQVSTAHTENSVPLQTPTPYQELTPEQCQQRIAQYVPGQFLYVPRECQQMLEAYKQHLQEQEREAERRRQREEYEAMQRQRREEYDQNRRAAEQRRRTEEGDRMRRQQIDQWGRAIGGIIRDIKRRKQ